MLEGAFHGNILCVENGRLIHKNDTLLPGLVHTQYCKLFTILFRQNIWLGILQNILAEIGFARTLALLNVHAKTHPNHE